MIAFLRRFLWTVVVTIGLGFLSATGAPVAAEGPPPSFDRYAGLGVLHGGLHGDHPSVAGRRGDGVHLTLGARLVGGLWLDLLLGGYTIDVGPTPDVFYPTDRADAMMIDCWLLYRGGEILHSGWRPWLTAGPSYHYLTWHDFAYTLSGWGAGAGAGLDRPVHRLFRLRLGVRYDRFGTRADYLAPGRSSDLEEFTIHAGVLIRLPS